MSIEIWGKYWLICMGSSAWTTFQRTTRLKSMISLHSGSHKVWIVDQRFKASQTLGWRTRFWGGFSHCNPLDTHRGVAMRLLGWWAMVQDILGRRSRWGYIASSLLFSLARMRHEAGCYVPYHRSNSVSVSTRDVLQTHSWSSILPVVRSLFPSR